MPNGRPLDMLLWCPLCHTPHVDAPDVLTAWTNPPHRSHLCHMCGAIWRPADVPTNGVATIATRGKADTWPLTSFRQEDGPPRAYGLAILRLNADIIRPTSGEIVRRAGDRVRASWHDGRKPFAKGWMIEDLGWSLILRETDVEVIEPP